MTRSSPLHAALSLLLLSACDGVDDGHADDDGASALLDSDDLARTHIAAHTGHHDHPESLSDAVHGTAAPDDCTQVYAAALAPMSDPCGNGYYDIGADEWVDSLHDTCYWPRPVSSTSAVTPGMVNTATWLAGNVQATPIYKPFRQTDVGIVSGWMYDETGRHCGVDYARGGGSFEVRAVADGVVVFVGYMPSPGNVVILEHTMPDGSKYRTIHHHLRNGRDADIASARRTMAHSNAYGSNWQTHPRAPQYQALADADAAILANNPTAAQVQAVESRWGSNSQTLSLEIGDPIKAGQTLGWAGQTGFDQYGVHLHIMFARPATVRLPGTLTTENRWVFFDPYGLYTGPTNACYQGFAPTGAGGANRHASVLSPVPAEFPLTGHENFQTIFSYFASKNMAPRSLATDSSVGWKVAGAFAPRNVIPVTRFLSTLSQHQADYTSWLANGWIPDNIVGMTTTGAARYTAIWAPTVTGTESQPMMTPAFFSQRWSALYNTHRLTDVSLYNEGGALYVSGIWKPQAGGGYAMYYGKTRAEFDAMHASMLGAGARAVQVVKYDHPGLGDRYAGLWHILGAEAVSEPFLDLTADQLTAQRDLYIGALGMKVKHLSAYKGLYSVIFTNQ